MFGPDLNVRLDLATGLKLLLHLLPCRLIHDAQMRNGFNRPGLGIIWADACATADRLDDLASSVVDEFANPAIGLASGIVLLRSIGTSAFTERERSFVEAAFPHLLGNCTTYRVKDLLREVGLVRQSTFSAASVEADMIVAAEPDFGALMQKEWRDWTGPVVPAELIALLAKPDPTSYVGGAITLRAIPSRRSSATLLTVRERHAADLLTDRQMEVACRRALGADHRTIASELSITPNTARNHISEIHRRLGIGKSAALGPILERLGFLEKVRGSTP